MEEDPVVVLTLAEMDPTVYWTFTFSFLVTFGCTASDAENRVQMFSIHREEDCKDAGEFFTKSERNLARLSPLVTCGVMRCFCNHYGLWIFSTYKNFKPSRRHPMKSGFSLFELHGETCESRKLNWRFLQLHSIRHVGSSDTSVRSLSLYQRGSFLGPELRMTGSSLSLPTPLEFDSAGFTGGRAWAIFPNPNYNGNFTCIGPPKQNSLIYNHPNIPLTVGSIYFKCPKNVNYTIPRPKNYLILYKNGQDEGRNRSNDAVLYIDALEIQLPAPQIFVEYSIGGSEKWTIYAGLDFNGKSRCLATFGQKNMTGKTKNQRFRFRRSKGEKELSGDDKELPDFGETWIIGSARFGCFSSSGTQDNEDYEDQLYDYYERSQPIEDDNVSFEWNKTNINVTTPVYTNHCVRTFTKSEGFIEFAIAVVTCLCYGFNA